jgi:hypothetical protein
MRIGWRSTLVVVTVAGLSAARAEPRPTAKDQQLARDLVSKAIARSQAGDHEAAIASYVKAFSILPNPVLLSNIGSEFLQSGKPRDALRYFCLYLEQEPEGSVAAYATSQARSLQIQLGNQIDDRDDVCAPARPRPRLASRERELATSPEPAAAAIDRTRGGELEGEAPPAQRTSSALMYVGVAAGIAGISGIGLGAYAGVRAKSISDDITHHDPAAPWPTNIHDLERRGRDYETLEIAGLVGGIGLIATGVVLYVIGRPDSPPDRTTQRTSARAAIQLAPTRHGLAVLGQF